MLSLSDDDEYVIWPVTVHRKFYVLRRFDVIGATQLMQSSGLLEPISTSDDPVVYILVRHILEKLSGMNLNMAVQLKDTICPLCFERWDNVPNHTKKHLLTYIWANDTEHKMRKQRRLMALKYKDSTLLKNKSVREFIKQACYFHAMLKNEKLSTEAFLTNLLGFIKNGNKKPVSV